MKDSRIKPKPYTTWRKFQGGYEIPTEQIMFGEIVIAPNGLQAASQCRIERKGKFYLKLVFADSSEGWFEELKCKLDKSMSLNVFSNIMNNIMVPFDDAGQKPMASFKSFAEWQAYIAKVEIKCQPEFMEPIAVHA